MGDAGFKSHFSLLHSWDCDLSQLQMASGGSSPKAISRATHEWSAEWKKHVESVRNGNKWKVLCMGYGFNENKSENHEEIRKYLYAHMIAIKWLKYR